MWVFFVCFFSLSRVNTKVFIKASGPASVTVLPKEKGKEGLNAAITAVGSPVPHLLTVIM